MKNNRLYRIRNPFKLITIVIIDFIGYLFEARPRNFPSLIRKVLIVRNDNLGDLVLTLPLIDAIMQGFPNVKLDLYASSRWKDLFEYDPRINQYYSFENSINNNVYDVIIDMKGGFGVANKVRHIKNQYIIGIADNGFSFWYDKPLFVPSQDPFEKIKLVLKVFTKDLSAKIVFPGKITGYNRKDKIERIVIAPFSSRPEKDWTNEKYIELSRKISNYSKSVVFVGLQIDYKKFSQFPKDSIHIFQKNQLKEYIQFIANSELVIAPDSAAIHIAAALGVRSISLFGPEDPLKWHPYNQKINRYIKVSGNVKDISVENVIKNFDSLLKNIIS